ncbi:MAG TPA: hypothetical protein EYP90_06030, partial [Chromatiaceae bacterium]|nr:hypothetical protein [Chromatiaceae bacterium]
GGRVGEFQDLLGNRARVIAGGKQRIESIESLVQATDEPLLLMQDVARPFVSARLCREVVNLAARYGAAGAFLDPMVPVGQLRADGVVRNYWPRRSSGIFQAPQAYRKEILLDAFNKAGGRHFQSPAEMVLDAGFDLAHAEGENSNIKITTEWDWTIARKVIAPMMDIDVEEKS